MVTEAKGIQIVNGYVEPPKEYRGLSTDSKPAAANGSTFLEMDTGKIYFYNADGSTWIEWGA